MVKPRVTRRVRDEMAHKTKNRGKLIKTLTAEETADVRARMGLDAEGLRRSREDDLVWPTLQREFPDWPLAEIKQVAGSVSPLMSAEGRRVQERYQALMAGR